jgi:hypothetical protein
LLKADLPASAATHNSARFTYVSPAGRLVRPGPREGGASQRFGFVIDGGYFENYGAITALQLARHAVASLRPQQPTRPVVILISSDPALRERDHERIVDLDRFCRGEPGGFFRFERADAGWANALFNEFLAPAAGILASREAHGTLAAKELARFVCAEGPASPGSNTAETPARDSSAAESPRNAGAPAEPVFVHFVMCGEKGSAPPLGWVLSGAARQMIIDMIDGQEDRCGNRAELDKLVRAIGDTKPGIRNGDASTSQPADR